MRGRSLIDAPLTRTLSPEYGGEGIRERRGISLLEVLISVFILSVGLLGLLALIPVGSVDVLEAVKADRGSGAGRAVHREVKVRKMFDPGMWMSANTSDDGTGQVWREIDDFAWLETTSTPVDHGHSICIDPQFIARNTQLYNNYTGGTNGLPPYSNPFDPMDANTYTWPGYAFPYVLDNDPGEALSPGVATLPAVAPRMTRVSIRAWPSLSAPPVNFSLADRIFSWRDDLTFNLPTDETLRPLMEMGADNRVQYDGNYTWMATLTPAEGHEDLSAQDRRMYDYTVIVFYKRNFSQPVPIDRTNALDNANHRGWNLADRLVAPPSERMVFADFLTPSLGWGGGEVRLRLVLDTANSLVTNTDGGVPEQSDFTNIRAGNWILLSGYKQNPLSGDDPEYADWHRTTFQWYRVLAVGDGPELRNPADPVNPQPTASNGPEWVRDVTLSGPDWNMESSPYTSVNVWVNTPPWEQKAQFSAPLYQDADGVLSGGRPNTVFATLVEGVVAVFTKKIELDTWSGW